MKQPVIIPLFVMKLAALKVVTCLTGYRKAFLYAKERLYLISSEIRGVLNSKLLL